MIAVGDAGLLGSVEAVGWLAALTHDETGPTLCEVMRQRDPDEQRPFKRFVTVIPTGTSYGRREAVMIARDNLTRERLNRAARNKLKTTSSSESRT